MSEVLTLQELKQIEAKYIPRIKHVRYGSLALILCTKLEQVIESHKTLLSAYEDTCKEMDAKFQILRGGTVGGGGARPRDSEIITFIAYNNSEGGTSKKDE